MVTTCFFCQNLLSDFIEGILPSSRHDELKKHLSDCPKCSKVHKEIVSTLDLMKHIPRVGVSGELSLRISAASEAARKGVFSKVKVSQIALMTSAVVVLFMGLVVAFPQILPFASFLTQGGEEGHFARYYPLNQGALEVVEEQGNWLHVREPFSGSVWEEGGLSPEEFEKTFDMKGPRETTQ